MKNELNLVTVLCKTFNHEKYIKDALDGFVMQKTDFKFKVIVQDDASSDGTAKIVKEYEKKYPELFDNIYHKENKYSQGINTDYEYIKEKLEGKYIAYCEGDDYWTSAEKLQTIVNYMEKHQECSMCFHSCNVIESETKNVLNIFPTKNIDERDLMVDEVINSKVEIQLASATFKREIFESRPTFFFESRVGDFPLYVFSLEYGNIHFIPKNMSNYRFHSAGSWNERVSKDLKISAKSKEEMISFLAKYNEYTTGKYEIHIKRRIEYLTFYKNYELGDYQKSYKSNYFDSAQKSIKREIYIGLIFPYIYRIKQVYKSHKKNYKPKKEYLNESVKND